MPFPADDAGQAQLFEVMRNVRDFRMQFVGDVADDPGACAERLQYLQPLRVGQGFQITTALLRIERVAHDGSFKRPFESLSTALRVEMRSGAK